MDAVDSSDADESLAAVIQRCELQIAALAGRLDAESVRRSAVTREISATVESQLLAVRSTVQGLAVLRAAVEEIDDELEELGKHRAVTESHAPELDVAPAPRESGTSSYAERKPREDAPAQAEMATLRGTLTEARAELARLGQALQRSEHGVAEIRGEIERSAASAAASAREAAQALVEGVRDEMRHAAEDLDAARGLIGILRDESVTAERAIESLHQVVETVREEARVATGAIGAARDEMDLVHAGLERTQEETRTLREELGSLRSGLARQDELVDARITTSHRATEALRGELTELRAQMQEMVTLMRDQAPPARPATGEPLAAPGQVTTARRLAERLPGGRLLWRRYFPPPQ